MPKPRGRHRFPCRVEFYAGSRAGETPRRVRWAGREAAVEKVLRRRRLRDALTGRTVEEFQVVLEGRTARLRQTPSGRWSLVFPPD
jgi:hypothetical protein